MEIVDQVIGGTTGTYASQPSSVSFFSTSLADSRRSRGIQCSVETSSGSSSGSGEVLLVCKKTVADAGEVSQSGGRSLELARDSPNGLSTIRSLFPSEVVISRSSSWPIFNQVLDSARSIPTSSHVSLRIKRETRRKGKLKLNAKGSLVAPRLTAEPCTRSTHPLRSSFHLGKQAASSNDLLSALRDECRGFRRRRRPLAPSRERRSPRARWLARRRLPKREGSKSLRGRV